MRVDSCYIAPPAGQRRVLLEREEEFLPVYVCKTSSSESKR